MALLSVQSLIGFFDSKDKTAFTLRYASNRPTRPTDILPTQYRRYTDVAKHPHFLDALMIAALTVMQMLHSGIDYLTIVHAQHSTIYQSTQR